MWESSSSRLRSADLLFLGAEIAHRITSPAAMPPSTTKTETDINHSITKRRKDEAATFRLWTEPAPSQYTLAAKTARCRCLRKHPGRSEDPKLKQSAIPSDSVEAAGIGSSTATATKGKRKEKLVEAKGAEADRSHMNAKSICLRRSSMVLELPRTYRMRSVLGEHVLDGQGLPSGSKRHKRKKKTGSRAKAAGKGADRKTRPLNKRIQRGWSSTAQRSHARQAFRMHFRTPSSADLIMIRDSLLTHPLVENEQNSAMFLQGFDSLYAVPFHEVVGASLTELCGEQSGITPHSVLSLESKRCVLNFLCKGKLKDSFVTTKPQASSALASSRRGFKRQATPRIPRPEVERSNNTAFVHGEHGCLSMDNREAQLVIQPSAPSHFHSVTIKRQVQIPSLANAQHLASHSDDRCECLPAIPPTTRQCLIYRFLERRHFTPLESHDRMTRKILRQYDSTKHEARSTKHEARSTKHEARSTKHEARSRKHDRTSTPAGCSVSLWSSNMRGFEGKSCELVRCTFISESPSFMFQFDFKTASFASTSQARILLCSASEDRDRTKNERRWVHISASWSDVTCYGIVSIRYWVGIAFSSFILGFYSGLTRMSAFKPPSSIGAKPRFRRELDYPFCPHSPLTSSNSSVQQQGESNSGRAGVLAERTKFPIVSGNESSITEPHGGPAPMLDWNCSCLPSTSTRNSQQQMPESNRTSTTHPSRRIGNARESRSTKSSPRDERHTIRKPDSADVYEIYIHGHRCSLSELLSRLATSVGQITHMQAAADLALLLNCGANSQSNSTLTVQATADAALLGNCAGYSQLSTPLVNCAGNSRFSTPGSLATPTAPGIELLGSDKRQAMQSKGPRTAASPRSLTNAAVHVGAKDNVASDPQTISAAKELGEKRLAAGDAPSPTKTPGLAQRPRLTSGDCHHRQHEHRNHHAVHHHHCICGEGGVSGDHEVHNVEGQCHTYTCKMSVSCPDVRSIRNQECSCSCCSDVLGSFDARPQMTKFVRSTNETEDCGATYGAARGKWRLPPHDACLALGFSDLQVTVIPQLDPANSDVMEYETFDPTGSHFSRKHIPPALRRSMKRNLSLQLPLLISSAQTTIADVSQGEISTTQCWLRPGETPLTEPSPRVKSRTQYEIEWHDESLIAYLQHRAELPILNKPKCGPSCLCCSREQLPCVIETYQLWYNCKAFNFLVYQPNMEMSTRRWTYVHSQRGAGRLQKAPSTERHALILRRGARRCEIRIRLRKQGSLICYSVQARRIWSAPEQLVRLLHAFMLDRHIGRDDSVHRRREHSYTSERRLSRSHSKPRAAPSTLYAFGTPKFLMEMPGEVNSLTKAGTIHILPYTVSCDPSCLEAEISFMFLTEIPSMLLNAALLGTIQVQSGGEQPVRWLWRRSNVSPDPCGNRGGLTDCYLCIISPFEPRDVSLSSGTVSFVCRRATEQFRCEHSRDSTKLGHSTLCLLRLGDNQASSPNTLIPNFAAKLLGYHDFGDNYAPRSRNIFVAKFRLLRALYTSKMKQPRCSLLPPSVPAKFVGFTIFQSSSAVAIPATTKRHRASGDQRICRGNVQNWSLLQHFESIFVSISGIAKSPFSAVTC
ncbi:uncharacterized protein MYCFIDRAFT_179680 [Pseudocercospora fijiensis CIRAD86]|uniref:Uncharacterized protein n=1 Tax=Pseudocercospora fijiensis (strain CIRAD86) TaxID=383855 RepID=M2YI78_PSEFD|nr:uncharacterized protein MYCFIDRAFT_179680 [Pseudocercospora fijiensis CIRAD86]EME77475.1 hypothetical protein MYCFIDRAFT_179680 [Pseudocercospora fijiensis CIRAD86]